MPLRGLVVVLVALALPIPVAAQSWSVAAGDWARPRSGERIRAMEPVAAAVRAWSRHAGGGRIVIYYPGGEPGELWANELRSWLVALGVPGHAVDLVAGAPARRLRLELDGGDAG